MIKFAPKYRMCTHSKYVKERKGDWRGIEPEIFDHDQLELIEFTGNMILRTDFALNLPNIRTVERGSFVNGSPTNSQYINHQLDGVVDGDDDQRQREQSEDDEECELLRSAQWREFVPFHDIFVLIPQHIRIDLQSNYRRKLDRKLQSEFGRDSQSDSDRKADLESK